MSNQVLAPCQAMVSIEDGEPFAEQIQQHIDRLPNDALAEATIDLKAHLDAVSALIAVHVRELDSRQIPQIESCLSTAAWLRHNTRMTSNEASGLVKTARALGHMPTVTEHALAGSVPARSVQLLSQARDRHRDEFHDHEEIFGDAATYLSVADLRKAIGHWEQQVNYPKALQDAEHVEGLRSAFLSQTIDGIGDLRATLTPQGYATVKTALDAHSDPFNLDADDHRTPTQRRADALVDIHRFWLDHNTTTKTSVGEKPHITVTVDYAVLEGKLEQLPTIGDIPVSPAVIRELTCDAGIIPVVLGSDSEPLDIGRKTRTIPSGLRRAIELRDRHCTWPGCHAPPSWCDVHHNYHWADGGETSLANCRLLCRKHHTATHQLEDSSYPPKIKLPRASCAVMRAPPDT